MTHDIKADSPDEAVGRNLSCVEGFIECWKWEDGTMSMAVENMSNEDVQILIDALEALAAADDEQEQTVH